MKETDLQKWVVCIDGRFEYFDTKLKTCERTKKTQKLVGYRDGSIQRQ